MTVFGKILVILTLLLCLVVAGLCVFVYTAGVNNFRTANKAIENMNLAEADAKAWKEAYDREMVQKGQDSKRMDKVAVVKPGDDLDTKIKKIEDEIKARDEQIRTLVADKVLVEKDLLTEKKKTAQFDSLISAAQTENAQKNKDLDRLKKLYDAEVTKNINLQAVAIKANQDKTAAEIARNALQDTNKGLEERMQDMVKEIRRLQQQVLTAGTPSTGTGASLTARNPPTANLEGKVMAVGGSGEQVELSIGSDAGLQMGHTLEVFRFSPKPLYLGYIRIIKITPTSAVGQVIGKPVAPLQRGDNVASRIQGS